MTAAAEPLVDRRTIAERPWNPGENVAADTATNSEVRLTAGLFVAALTYATLRYNVFKGVAWADWPAYTLNKAMAVASLMMITVTVFRWRGSGKGTSILMGAAGALAITHSLVSFALLNPLYYPRMFEAGKLTAAAGLSLTLGAAITAVLELGGRRSRRWSFPLRHKALALVVFAGAIHASLTAVATWFEPGTWPGGMPPLTLLSVLISLAALAAWRIRPL